MRVGMSMASKTTAASAPASVRSALGAGIAQLVARDVPSAALAA